MLRCAGPVLSKVLVLWRLYLPLALVLLSACTSEPVPPATKATLPFQLAGWPQIVSLTSGALFAVTTTTPLHQTFWYQTPGSEQWHQAVLPNGRDCSATYYAAFTPLPDGRLGLEQLCLGDWHDAAGKYTDKHVSLLAFDVVTGGLSPLVDRFLPLTGPFSWNPTLERGMLSTIGSYGTLFWLTPHEVTPLTATLTKGRKSWRFSDSVAAEQYYHDHIFDLPTNYPHPVGMVDAPAWSPDGTAVAFFATLDTIGTSWNFPINVPHDLYLMDPNTLVLHRALTGVRDPYDLQWSPDGRWLVYKQATEIESLWLFAPTTGKRHRVAVGHMSSVTWADKGQSLLVMRCSASLCEHAELWKYDVRSLVAP
ncbi:MAG: hypothetical protein NVSMB42_22800 [Herpetosiphon sp.]